MVCRTLRKLLIAPLLVGFSTWASGQAFRVQCPSATSLHPGSGAGAYPANTYTGPVRFADTTTGLPYTSNGGQIKCQQVSGGDGYATMADGTQIYLFAFGPLSGLADIAAGLPGTETPDVFNTVFPGNLQVGDPATTDGGPTGLGAFNYNGAVGLAPNIDNGNAIDGHVDPRPIMDVGVMNGNEPAPLLAINEDDEFFLTLTNVGMLMRPDLFEQHTIHFHGYPNASSYFDGVPDASVAINIGGSMTYYYLAPDAGTYFWHCHITPPEHLQMGMVGQLYVRPRQNRVPLGKNLYASLQLQQTDLRTAARCLTPGQPGVQNDILCATPPPSSDNGFAQTTDLLTGKPYMYAYNDGDGSTRYDVEYPLQIHGFDPNFHYVGMTFNPEDFAGMKDKYFLLNGRSYPDTIQPGPMQTPASDGTNHFSQPLPSIINIPAGGRALLRISDLDVTEYQTLASLGIPMKVIALNARLLRDQAGSNLYYNTNSITMAGGESLDLILDASDKSKYPSGSVFFLYTPNLDHLSNDAENFGGLMTEVHIL
jgi:FtsP/CotA-like multicopper oxidase with cupredoxin domain